MKVVSALLPVFAWLLSVSPGLWLRSAVAVTDAAVLVPLVSVSDRSGRDVVSDVTGFAVVAGWGLLCALLVEPTKAAAHAGGRPIATYSLLVGYQVVLLFDTVRAHAFDWWRWLLALTGTVTLPTFPEVRDMPGFRFPWLSCVVSIASAVVVFYSFTRANDRVRKQLQHL